MQFKQIYYICICLFILTLEIQLSTGEVWDPIDGFNPVTCLYLSRARNWISIGIFHVL